MTMQVHKIRHKLTELGKVVKTPAGVSFSGDTRFPSEAGKTQRMQIITLVGYVISLVVVE